MGRRRDAQGLADTFILLGLPFDSPQAQQLNKEIFEAIYYAGLRTSCQLAQKHGAAPLQTVFPLDCILCLPICFPYSVLTSWLPQLNATCCSSGNSQLARAVCACGIKADVQD